MIRCQRLAGHSSREVAGALNQELVGFFLCGLARQSVVRGGPRKGEGEVDIVAWPGYIERGETDKAYDWVTGFEKETGCKVNVKTAGTSDEMVALMNEGGFDLVTASGDACLRLVAGKQVQEINTAPDPELEDGRPAAAERALAHGRRQALRRALPVGPERADVQHRGLQGRRPRAGTSCSRSRPCPTASRTRAACRRSTAPIYIADAALYLMAQQARARHQGPLRADRGRSTRRRSTCCASSAARAALLARRRWCRSTTSPTRAWSPRAPGRSRSTCCRAEKQPIASTIPEEGATGWADTTMMHADAAHPNCAYMWLEHSLEPKLQGDLAAWFGSVPAVPAACKGNELLTDEGCETNGSRTSTRSTSGARRSPSARAQPRRCVPYYRWVTDYIAILGGR